MEILDFTPNVMHEKATDFLHGPHVESCEHSRTAVEVDHSVCNAQRDLQLLLDCVLGRVGAVDGRVKRLCSGEKQHRRASVHGTQQ